MKWRFGVYRDFVLLIFYKKSLLINLIIINLPRNTSYYDHWQDSLTATQVRTRNHTKEPGKPDSDITDPQKKAKAVRHSGGHTPNPVAGHRNS